MSRLAFVKGILNNKSLHWEMRNNSKRTVNQVDHISVLKTFATNDDIR